MNANKKKSKKEKRKVHDNISSPNNGLKCEPSTSDLNNHHESEENYIKRKNEKKKNSDDTGDRASLILEESLKYLALNKKIEKERKLKRSNV